MAKGRMPLGHARLEGEHYCHFILENFVLDISDAYPLLML